ncbi:MAG: alpha-glucosidase, partial [Chitinophagaceae bacterium]
IEQRQLQDPYGITFWPRFKGRDGCRTPMPWNKADLNAGFSQANTWLPVSPEHLPAAIDVQEVDQHSVLNAFRHFLAWRKMQPALLWGDINFLDAPDNVLMFVRQYQEQRIVAVFNLSGDKVVVDIDNKLSLESIETGGSSLAQYEGNQLLLDDYASAFLRVK